MLKLRVFFSTESLNLTGTRPSVKTFSFIRSCDWGFSRCPCWHFHSFKKYTFLPVDLRLQFIKVSPSKRIPDHVECSGVSQLCLLLPQLCTEPLEQWLGKFRKMPLCSDSESKDSRTWSITLSRLDGGLVPELRPRVSTLEDVEQLDTSEPVQCTSVLGEGSGRMQGDGCCDWTGWGHFLRSWMSWMEVTVSA